MDVDFVLAMLFLIIVGIGIGWLFKGTNTLSNDANPAGYYQRSKQRLEDVMQESERLERLLNSNQPDMRGVGEGARRLRTLAEE